MGTYFALHRTIGPVRVARTTVRGGRRGQDWVGTLAQQPPYAGPDRRRPVAFTDHQIGSKRLLVWSAVALVAWCALVRLTRNGPIQVQFSVGQLVRSLAAAAFLTAGAMRFAIWRLTGEAQVAWNAMALVVLGLTLPLVAALRLLSTSGAGASVSTPAARLLMVFAVISLMIFALTSSPVNSSLQPLKIVGPLLLGAAIAPAVVFFRGRPIAPPTPLRLDVYLASEWTAAGLWIVLALAHLRAGLRNRRPTQLWSAASLALMGATELAHAQALTGPARLVEFSVGLQLLAAVLAVSAGAVRLWEVFTVSGTRTLKLAGDLRVVRTDLVDSEQRERERLHDARTAIVGVMGASRLLSRPESVVGVDPDRLYSMMTAELHRLGSLLDPDAGGIVEAFRLADAVEPVVLAHRLAGAEVHLQIDRTWAIGCPQAMATVMANLLSNARAHAPGARITVSATTTGSTAVVRVDDDGPGIPLAERDQLLQRGVRGSTANGPGSGLGLHTAARAMAQQGGSLELTDRPGGGTSVILRLSAALDQEHRDNHAQELPLPPLAPFQEPTPNRTVGGGPSAPHRVTRGPSLPPTMASARMER